MAKALTFHLKTGHFAVEARWSTYNSGDLEPLTDRIWKKSVFLQKLLSPWGQGGWKFVISPKPLLILGILQDQRKLEFIILPSGSKGKGNNTPKLDLKVVLQSFYNTPENFCFSQAGIQDSPQVYFLHVAFHERKQNLDRKKVFLTFFCSHLYFFWL